MKKRIFLFSIIFLFVYFSSFAQSFALIMSQSDENSSNVNETTKRMENAIMDAFFNQGFIISNEPIVTNSEELYTKMLSDAVQSNVAYIVSVELVYKNSQNAKAKEVFLNWELMDAQFIKNSVKGNVDSKQFAKIFESRDANKAIKSFSNSLVAEITANLKNLSSQNQKFLGLQR